MPILETVSERQFEKSSPYPYSRIPADVIVPIVDRMTLHKNCCCDNFSTYDYEKIREECGSPYAGIPLDDIRRQCVNLRKADKLAPVHGHGAGKPSPLSREMLAYYKTPHWKKVAFAARLGADHRCQICHKAENPLEVHHNTYERLGHEVPKDLIALCRQCHKWADVRRRKQSVLDRVDEGGTFFEEGD